MKLRMVLSENWFTDKATRCYICFEHLFITDNKGLTSILYDYLYLKQEQASHNPGKKMSCPCQTEETNNQQDVEQTFPEPGVHRGQQE